MDTTGNTLLVPKTKQIQNIQKATLEKANSAPNGLLLFKQKTIKPNPMSSTSLDTTQPCASVPNISQPVEIPGIDLLKNNSSKSSDEMVKNHVCKQLAYFVQNTIIFRGKETPKLKSMVSSLSSEYRYYWIITSNSVLEGKTGPSCQPNQHIITFNDRLRLPWVCHACKRRGMTLSDVVLHVAAEHKKHKIIIHDLEGNKLSDFLMKVHDDYLREMDKLKTDKPAVPLNLSNGQAKNNNNNNVTLPVLSNNSQPILSVTQNLLNQDNGTTRFYQKPQQILTNSTMFQKNHLFKSESSISNNGRVMRTHPPLGKTRSMSPYLLQKPSQKSSINTITLNQPITDSKSVIQESLMLALNQTLAQNAVLNQQQRTAQAAIQNNSRPTTTPSPININPLPLLNTTTASNSASARLQLTSILSNGSRVTPAQPIQINNSELPNLSQPHRKFLK